MSQLSSKYDPTIVHYKPRKRLRPWLWVDKLTFLLVNSLGERYHHNRGAIVFAFIEPLAIIGLLTWANWATNSPPPFGDSLLLFHTTGVVPFYLFFHIAIRLRNIDTYRMLPQVSKFDQILARVISESLIKVTILIIVAMILRQIDAKQWYPQDTLQGVVCLICLIFFSTMIGIINMVITTFFPVWWYAFVLLTRSMLLLSAVPSVMDRVPQPFRTWTLWNPLSHYVTWFRASWYKDYPIETLDLSYLAKVTVICTIVAFVFENSTRSMRDIR